MVKNMVTGTVRGQIMEFVRVEWTVGLSGLKIPVTMWHLLKTLPYF
jgi:hypothetical protein